jgi:transcriptional regulator with XRE-family HTH domain
VTDNNEPTGVRVVRLRRELGWTQLQLSAAAGVSVGTIRLIERDKPGKRGERESTGAVLKALEAESLRRDAPAPSRAPSTEEETLMELLARHDWEDVRIRRVGPHRKLRWYSFTLAVPDVDATPQQIVEDRQAFDRQESGARRVAFVGRRRRRDSPHLR